MTEYREIDFTPADWAERAAWWPGLQVHSRRVRVPVDATRHCKSVDEIEQLLREALLPEPIDPNEMEPLDTSERRNTVAQLVER